MNIWIVADLEELGKEMADFMWNYKYGGVKV
jgi:hypothetical protein